jgi:hypothetical protein
MDRQPDRLAQNVPDRDVDGAEGRADDRAHKVGVTRDGLVVVLDAGEVFADEVSGSALRWPDRSRRGAT